LIVINCYGVIHSWCNLFFDVVLYLLKRHSGIVWDPGLFAGLLRQCGGDVRRLEEEEEEERV